MKHIVAAMVLLTTCPAVVGQTQPAQAQPQSPVVAHGGDPSRGVTPTEETPKFRAEARQMLLGALVFRHAADKRPPDESLLPADALKRYPRYVVTELVAYAKKLDDRLAASDFHVFDNGIEQHINYFKKSTLPLEDWNGSWSFAPTSRGTWGFPPLDATHWIRYPVLKYVIGYVPPALEPGKCHGVRVAVEDREVDLDRDRYCAAARSDDLDEATLEGTDVGTKMRVFADSDAPGFIGVSAQTFAFWSSRVLSLVTQSPAKGGTALPSSDLIYVLQVHDSNAAVTVHVAVEFVPPWKLWDPDCPQKPALYVLGIAYGDNHQIAGQLGETLPCILQSRKLGCQPRKLYCPDKLEVPTRFDAQLELMPGDYDLRVVVSDGKRQFGKTRVPVHVEAFDGQRLSISDVVLSSSPQDASKVLDDAVVEVSPALVVPTPLISKNVQFIPDIQTRIQQHTRLPLYFEIYEPLLKQQAAEVYMHLRVTDLQTGLVVLDSGSVSAANWVLPGNSVIPVGFSLGTHELEKGDYRLEVQASDGAGATSVWRQAKFTID